ncbi:glycine/sarcosine/betaine reductase component B subunit [Bacillota bacterium LX-D]|nr:glycine/sarcosine/betaine reductase component B subunit [Bacillota bacterium LX-D]
MRLEIGEIQIKDVQYGSQTEIRANILYLNQEELCRIVADDDRISYVKVFIAKPGASVRIIPVKDVLEPRVKVRDSGGIFPGFCHKVDMVGEGRTHVLKGTAVVTTGKIVGFQEGIIDMSGTGAKYTPFSQTLNVVLQVQPKENLAQHEQEEVIRLAGFKAACYLGEAGKNIQPDEIKTLETKPLLEQIQQYPNLPKVLYVYMLQSQGLLHDTYVYGVDAKKIIPTYLYPTEVLDGAIVSGNCVSACDKNPTYMHQNNPVILDLYNQHGKTLNFLGCIITNENVTLADKERSAQMTAKLVELLGADGVIISKEGFGNPDADLILNCQFLEKKGIKTVLLTDEYAGRDGASQSLADSTPLGNAVISTGNANQIIKLPKLDLVIGYPEVAEQIAGGFKGSIAANESITAEIQLITGATNELGFGYLQAVDA